MFLASFFDSIYQQFAALYPVVDEHDEKMGALFLRGRRQVQFAIVKSWLLVSLAI